MGKKETRILMGMPVAVEICGPADQDDLDAVFEYFSRVDERFSTYKPESEIMRINRGELGAREASEEMREIFARAEETWRETFGYFDIRRPDGALDPSGIVKGWAIRNAADLLRRRGLENFFVDAGGDIQSAGKNARGEEWRVGIRNPFRRGEIVKVVVPRGRGVATSGSYIRGAHIYNPHSPQDALDEIVSITVIAPDVLEADRFATAAFAMGPAGISFLESRQDCEAYTISRDGIATMTSGFHTYAV